MTERLEIIFSEIPVSSLFADVGCDHGYIGAEMIKSGKCEKAIFSDVSAPSLKKAKVLLEKSGLKEKAEFYVCDGLDFPENPDTVLIAGMGGEEIVKILSLSEKRPDNLVLQPMKNARKLREFLVGAGYAINKDYVFFSAKKYYDIIVAFKGEDALTEEEKEFGRTNIKEKPAAFIMRVKERKEDLCFYLKNDLSKDSERKIKEEIKRLDEIICSR